jgi:hypothetical protein
MGHSNGPSMRITNLLCAYTVHTDDTAILKISMHLPERATMYSIS